MAKKYLSDNGLQHLWNKIKSFFVAKEDGKGLSTNDYTTAEKNKLAGIATGANKTVVDTSLSSTSTNPVQNKVVKAALDDKAASSHTHSQYYDSTISRTANTVLAAPNGSSGGASFRELVSADLPDLSSKYLPLSGGTLTGQLTGTTFVGALSGNASTATKLKTARKINGVAFDGSANIDVPRSSLPLHTARGTVGSSGYVKIATFTISSAYRDCNITIEYTRRGYIPVRLYIKWANVSSTDPDLSSFVFVNNTSQTCTAYMHKSATSTWNLYIQKAEKNDSISIIDCKKPGHMSDVTISWVDEHASSLPSGYVAATRMGVDTDTGWLTLADNVKYRKIGNIVEVRGTYTAPSSGGGMTIGTLPRGYRPSNSSVYNTNSISDNASKTYYTSVNTSGTLIISSSSGSTFTKDSTYNVNIMFMVG